MDNEKIFSQVLKKVTPTSAELAAEQKKVKDLMHEIKGIEGKHVGVILAGSISRGTHLRGDNDLDIFILFDKELSRQEFEKEGLRIAKKVFKGHEWEMAYSEHPYIRGKIDGFEVEIIPSYKIHSTVELRSAVDRTPFHTKYLQERFLVKHKPEVRLLKQFLKGIKCYGADLKTSSFSGYLTELLVLKYGSFEEVLRNASNWIKGQVIDLQNFWPEQESRKKFDSHFAVVDPTDKNRNVAAAISFNQFCRFIAASRAFLSKPSIGFFFPSRKKPWPLSKVKKMLKEEELIAVAMPYDKRIVSDVFWGLLKRFSKLLANQLEMNDFQIVRFDSWTDEKKIALTLVELESIELQKIHKRIGPEVTDKYNAEKFLKAHKDIVSGPRIEQGRWVVEVPRKHSNAKSLLSSFVKKFSKQSKKQLKKSLSKAKVLLEKDLLELYSKNKGFQEYFTEFLKGEEEFLH